MEPKTKILVQLLLLSVGICLGMMLTRACSKQKEIGTEIVKTDTLTTIKVDTNRVTAPKPISSIITGEYFAPFIEKLFFVDTVIVSDTIFVGGQTFYHEIKTYKDSTYKAQVSGINANLDYIEVYPKNVTKYVYKVQKVAEKPKKWGIGPQVGVGVINNQIYPYIGVGVQYNLIRF